MDEYQIKNFLKFAPARLGLAPKKHLFIHIPKNGGMSIRQAPQLQGKITIANRRRLKSKVYADAVLTAMSETGDHPGYEHARYRDVCRWVRNSHAPFAIVRNPWSRVVSRFTFSLRAMQKGSSAPDYSARDFEAFLEERHKWGSREYFWHRAIRGWYMQKDYLTDEQGKVCVPTLRLENLSEEFASYFNIPVEIERRNTSTKRQNYKDFYTARTIKIVADWYKEDVDYFGFDFDTSAKRKTIFS